MSEKSGTGNATITVTAKPNTSTTARNAELTIIVSGATPVKVNLSQAAAPEPDKKINIAAIAGVTPPVTGAVPVTTITETEQYTGSVMWSPNHDVFYYTAYTATVYLLPKEGYTLEGVPANFFTVAGTTMPATNEADEGIITAIFPELALTFAPNILIQPFHTPVTEGGSTKFSLAAGGFPSPIYQWQILIEGEWHSIAGLELNATGEDMREMTLEDLTMDMNGSKYRCVVSNIAGEIISNEVTLNITPRPTIELMPASLNFTSSGGPQTVTITSTTAWKFGTNLPSWLTVSTVSGTGTETVTITATPNTNLYSRSIMLTVSSPLEKTSLGYALPQTISVWQPGLQLIGSPALALMSVSHTSLSITGTSSKTFTITTTASWSVSSSESWLTVSPSSGTGNSTVTVTPTSVSTSRTAVITVSGTNTPTHTINVTQTRARLPNLPPADGSASRPFLVNSATMLAKVGSGTDGWTQDKHYKQTTDILFNGIGVASGTFTGTYDGQGYNIEGLYTPNSATNEWGMFRIIGAGGTVRNVALVSAVVKHAGWYIGGIAGVNRGTIENCYVTGQIMGHNELGGIAGVNYGTIKNCYTICYVNYDGKGNIGFDVGGIVGVNKAGGTIRHCYATGSITGREHVGCIIGQNAGAIDHCVALNAMIYINLSYNHNDYYYIPVMVCPIVGYGDSHSLGGSLARESGMIMYKFGNTRDGKGNLAANDYHGANSGAWWHEFGFSNTNWNCAPNRLPHLKTTSGAAFSRNQIPKVN